ncbi:MAG: DUF5672 family protein [Desulfobacterales bacterium]|nr:DUF5672 family protein [Desulfobacterales bacterium]
MLKKCSGLVIAYLLNHNNMKSKIAIVVPNYKPDLTAEEKISLRHLSHYLNDFPQFAIQPVGLGKCLEGVELREFPAHYFKNIKNYSKLLLSPEFYETFVEYDYVLIYQLDCLVFSDNLRSWCEMGYDYIGAPLFEKESQPPRISRVGNGGLSLRRVQSFLNVLNTEHIPPWSAVLTANLPDLKKFPLPARWSKKLRVIRDARRGIEWYRTHYSLNEDLFWSDRAHLFHPNFKIAPSDIALGFAFDAHPMTCFEQNNRQMPFGAHAWAKWNRDFWETYIYK